VNPIDTKTRAGVGAAESIAGWPVVLGNDFAGVVTASPGGATAFEVGAPVFGMLSVPRRGGAYAEAVTFDPAGTALIPEGLDPLTAAALPVAALTAWGAVVDLAAAAPGMRMLIHAGAGGVGHLAIQLAKQAGAWVATTASGA